MIICPHVYIYIYIYVYKCTQPIFKPQLCAVFFRIFMNFNSPWVQVAIVNSSYQTKDHEDVHVSGEPVVIQSYKVGPFPVIDGVITPISLSLHSILFMSFHSLWIKKDQARPVWSAWGTSKEARLVGPWSDTIGMDLVARHQALYLLSQSKVFPVASSCVTTSHRA